MILYTGKISEDTVDDYWEGSFEMCGSIGKKEIKETVNDKIEKCKKTYKTSMRKKKISVKNNSSLKIKNKKVNNKNTKK